VQDVLRVQKEQLNAEAEQAVRTAVSREREEFHNVMTTSLTRLQTIEDALDSRAAYVGFWQIFVKHKTFYVQDAENRRAKERWLACVT
jgi:phosphoenolpyruvate-protein kinase (PTS system EI component)